MPPTTATTPTTTPITTTMPVTTTTTTVTTTTEIMTRVTVVTVTSKLIYVPFSCSFDGNKFKLDSMTSKVKKEDGAWRIDVQREDTTVIQIAEPKLDGVTATLSVRSNADGLEWVEWAHGTSGFESPNFPNAGTVNIEITAVTTGGTTNPDVTASDSLSPVEEDEKGTTLIVIIRKPGLGDPPLTEG